MSMDNNTSVVTNGTTLAPTTVASRLDDGDVGVDKDCYNSDSLTITGIKSGISSQYATQFCGKSLKKGTVVTGNFFILNDFLT